MCTVLEKETEAYLFSTNQSPSFLSTEVIETLQPGRKAIWLNT